MMDFAYKELMNDRFVPNIDILWINIVRSVVAFYFTTHPTSAIPARAADYT